MLCPICNADLLAHHGLEDHEVPPMANKSMIFSPACSRCGYTIKPADAISHIRAGRKVLLVTGTAGAGKTAVGQAIQSASDYLFVDGDAVQKRVHYLAKRNPGMAVDCQGETIRTMLILLALGYNVVVGYIINRETLAQYTAALAKHGITPVFRVLVPERSVCLERDRLRECWTAGEVWVDQWYNEMRGFLATHPACCIDNSDETLEETVSMHFCPLL